jgi:hypothetical protein
LLFGVDGLARLVYGVRRLRFLEVIMVMHALKSLAKGRAFTAPLICTTMAVVGVVGIASPSQASSIRGAIFARALSLSGQTTGSIITGTDFVTGHYYRFDFGVTDNNTPTSSSGSMTQWGPNNPSNTDLPNRLYNYLTISKCASPVTNPTNCGSNVTTNGFVSGTYNTSPTYGTGTDLQQFAVGGLPTTTPAINMAFGSTSGVTGLMTKFNGVAGKDISNIQIGCNVSTGCSSDLSALVLEHNVNWNPVGPGISDLTATNIIQNLDLTMFTTEGFPNVNMGTGPDAPRCTTGSTPNAPCQLAIRINGESGGIFFNINSVEFTSVPGPLPISAAAVAFGCSRKLRSRVRSLANRPLATI